MTLRLYDGCVHQPRLAARKLAIMSDASVDLASFREVLQRYIRSILISAIVIGVIIAFVLVIVIPYERDQSIAKKIKATGGKVRFFYDGPEWVDKAYRAQFVIFDRIADVEFSGTTVSPALFEETLRLRHLKSLMVNGSQFGDQELRHLKGNTNLVDLRLYDTQVTDSGLEHLQGLSSLSRLHLSNAPIGDEGLKHLSLSGMTNLSELGLAGSQVTDEGLKYLSGIGHLMNLCLDNTQITDDGLGHLQDLKGGRSFRLMILSLNDTKIGDSGFAHLKGLYLETLNARSTKITDKGLEHLSGMTSLQSLDVSFTNIDGSGFANWDVAESLVQLILFGTRITDDSVEYLSRLPKIKSVHLSGTQISDLGLKHLQKSESLNDSNSSLHNGLNLFQTQTTAEGRAELRSVLKNCNVAPDP